MLTIELFITKVYVIFDHPSYIWKIRRTPVMFDLASDSDCSSDTDIAKETEGLRICCIEICKIINQIYNYKKMNKQKKGPIVIDMNIHPSRHQLI